jgi:hypothetical protein
MPTEFDAFVDKGFGKMKYFYLNISEIFAKEWNEILKSKRNKEDGRCMVIYLNEGIRIEMISMCMRDIDNIDTGELRDIEFYLYSSFHEISNSKI